MAAIFDEAYVEGGDARAQSGFGGDESRWELARRPIAWAVDRAGTFLDIGCANGHLMECVVRWSAFPVEPFGLDFSERLVELARARLPQWRDRIFLGNALAWKPPFRFDFVRTELLYVPERHRRLLTERLLNEVVAPGGRLIVCGYGSPRSGVQAHPVRADNALHARAVGGGEDPVPQRRVQLCDESHACTSRIRVWIIVR